MFLTKPLKEIWDSSAKQVLVFKHFVWYLYSTRFALTTITDLWENVQLSWQILLSQSDISSWCQVPVLTFGERRQAQQPVLFFPSATRVYFGWDRCLHPTLCSLACMGIHRHLEGFNCSWGIWWWGIKSDHAAFLHAARKICRTRKEGYQLALALEFEGLVTQFSELLMADMPLIMFVGTESGTSGSEV